MQMDDIVDELLEADVAHQSAEACAGVANSTVPSEHTQQHHERLASLVAGGQAKQYLGKALTVDQIDSLDEDEVEKLCTHYEARLGAAMTKTQGHATLQLYSGVVSMFLPIPPESQLALVHDLEAHLFVGHALSSATCELYHRYGMFLAPLTAALTTARHCQFGHHCSPTINNGGEPDQSSRSAEPVTDTSICGKSDRPGGGEPDQSAEPVTDTSICGKSHR